MAAKQKTDWDAVEPHYRSGVKSLRQLADEFGCTSGRVAQVAKERGWTRDLSAKIKAKADAKVSRSILSDKLSAQRTVTENEIVEANSDLVSTALLSQRKDISRLRSIHEMMVLEMGALTEFKDLFEGLGELMHAPDDKGADKLNDLYRHVIALPTRIKGTKELAETLKTLIGLEREALGITDRTPGSDDNPFAAVLRAVMGSALRPVVIEGESEVVING